MTDSGNPFAHWLAHWPDGVLSQWFAEAPIGLAVLDAQGRFLAVNKHLANRVGHSIERLLQMGFPDITHPDERVGDRQRRARLLDREVDQLQVDKRMVHADGRVLWARLQVRHLPCTSERTTDTLLVLVQDVVTDEVARLALERSEHRLRLALEGSGAGLWDWDLRTDVVEFSRGFSQLVRYQGDDFRRDFHFRTFLHPDDQATTLAAVERAIQGPQPFNCTYRLRCFDGSYRWFQGRGMTHRDAEGQPERFSGILFDIHERYEVEQALMAREQALLHQARHDSLTGLPNRLLWSERLAEALREASRHGHQLAVLMLDLDGFKDVNDTLGHGVGDELLRHLAQRLSQRLRAGDTLSRMGGDEFVWLMRGLSKEEDAARLARELVLLLSEPWTTSDGHEVHIGTSVGIALYPEHGQDEEALMKAADSALYRAKADGRGTYAYFSQDMTRLAAERLSLEGRLRQAVRDGAFELVFQPQWGVATDRLVGAEALIRWHDEVLGPIPPARFIPVAEACGLMGEIGFWVLDHACATLRRWIDTGWTEATMAINVSPRQFHRLLLIDQLRTVLQRYDLPPGSIELEITEGLLMERSEQTLEVLTQVKQMGVHVAVDDFGVGYSSLAYLKRFAVHTLKIDRTFIAQLESDPEDRAICSAIVAMGRALGVKVLAEGVENEAQWRDLAQMGCDYYQGYWRGGHPVPESRFTTDYLS
jgi:diguanylate cyclase (GGDEF)-like protein/PAS domain S-box-containing protein